MLQHCHIKQLCVLLQECHRRGWFLDLRVRFKESADERCGSTSGLARGAHFIVCEESHRGSKSLLSFHLPSLSCSRRR